MQTLEPRPTQGGWAEQLFGATVRHEERGTTLLLHGTIDAQAAPQLRRHAFELLALPLQHLVLDLTAVIAVSPTGHEVLEEVQQAATDRRVPLEFVDLPIDPGQ